MKTLIIISRIFSILFRPMYYPIVGFVILFTLTQLQLLPWDYKLWVLSATYLFTIGLPVFGIYLYRKVMGLSASQLRQRHLRLWPYIISLLCYVSYLRVMYSMHLPQFMHGIIVASLLIQGVCLLVTIRWKISMHAAGAGGIIGALMAYSFIFVFNPIGWLCVAILLDGLVMSSRMILRQHSFWQVMAGSLVGIVFGYLGIAYT